MIELSNVMTDKDCNVYKNILMQHKLNKIIILKLILFYSMNACIAQELKKTYPNLSKSIPEYSFQHWKTQPKVDIPVKLKTILLEHYKISEPLKNRIIIHSLFEFDQKYLVEIKIKGHKNRSKNLKESNLHNTIAKQHCKKFENEFNAWCIGKKPQRMNLLTVVNLQTKTVTPIPFTIYLNSIEKPTINTSEFPLLEKEAVENFSDLPLSLLNSISPGFFRTFKLENSLNHGTNLCFSGKFASSDVNGDTNKDLIVLIGDGVDQLLIPQVEPKIYAFVRIYMIAIDVSSDIAKLILSKELFSYEIDYHSTYDKNMGQGIVRASRLYWGDIDDDGLYDFIVRRRQSKLNINYNSTTPEWVANLESEKGFIYKGIDRNKHRLFLHNEEELLKFLKSNIDWKQGFPNSYNCP